MARRTSSPNSRPSTHAAHFHVSISPISRRRGNYRARAEGAPAISNTSPVSETDEPNGMKRVVFAQTRPLRLPGGSGGGSFRFGGRGEGGRPSRPGAHRHAQGKGQPGQVRREVTATCRPAGGYFGIPFPFDKVRQRGHPAHIRLRRDGERRGWSPMREACSLGRGHRAAAARSSAYAETAAHETGAPVVRRSGDDWRGGTTSGSTRRSPPGCGQDPCRMEAGMASRRATSTAEARRHERSDSLVSARRIRQPIESEGRHHECLRRHHLPEGRRRASACSRAGWARRSSRRA